MQNQGLAFEWSVVAAAKGRAEGTEAVWRTGPTSWTSSTARVPRSTVANLLATSPCDDGRQRHHDHAFGFHRPAEGASGGEQRPGADPAP